MTGIFDRAAQGVDTAAKLNGVAPLVPSSEPRFQVQFVTGEEEVKAMTYLVDPFIPENAAVGLYGKGASGKSLFASTTAATLSKKGLGTLWVSSEEPADEIAVRYTKSGGQKHGLAPFTHRPELIQGKEKVTFNVYEHLEPLIKQVKEQHELQATGFDLRLVVLDAIVTLVTFEKGESANDDKSVKRVMGFIHDLCQTHEVSILCLGHLRKNSSKDGGYEDMVMGAVAWTTSPRLSWMMGKAHDAEDDFESVLVTAKANKSVRAGCRLRTEPVVTTYKRENGPDDVLCRTVQVSDIAWGEADTERLYDALKGKPGQSIKKTREELKRAKHDFILHCIRERGCKTRTEINAALNEEGIPELSKKQWPAVETALQLQSGVRITKSEHGVNIYQG
jgi:hypothetical protein